jgi:Leucine-rich repeat (LRR) protein
LKQLLLDNNQIASIETLAFSDLPALALLSLQVCFDFCFSIYSHLLQHNGLTTLYRNAFDSLPKLAVLQLNNNALSQLSTLFVCLFVAIHILIFSPDRGMFEGVPNLQQLHMRSNKVTTIEPGTFDAVNSLTTLDLANNQIARLDKVCRFVFDLSAFSLRER